MEEFLQDTYKTSAFNFLLAAELYSCLAHLKGKKTDGVDRLKVAIVGMILKGLRISTGQAKLHMEYKHYRVRLMKKWHGKLAGWPSHIPFVNAHDMRDEEVREIYELLQSGSVRWEIDKVSTKLTEEFDPTHEDTNPGNRLRDRYPDRITFTEQAKDKEKSESESLAEWVTFLDRKLEILEDDPDTVVAATDASVPQNPRHQAASAAMIYRSGDLIHQTRALSDWFAGGDDRKVTFIQVPSKAKWSIHQLAHEFVRGLPPIGVGAVPQTSLDRLRQEATKAGQDAWVSRFQDPSYRGRHFYELQDLKDRPLQPSYLKGGTWLKLAGGSLSLTTRMTRCILGHAPIGEYYQRFNIQADLSCLCGVEPGTRAHVLYRCSELERGASLNRLPGLIAYLKANPRAFAFPSQAEAEGVG
ncbi:hypothetical protein PM082_008380 [Marasmius tenuissimus]|nr:hypothetical protein PM082_008380 [Marasmius tenuissimus]